MLPRDSIARTAWCTASYCFSRLHVSRIWWCRHPGHRLMAGTFARSFLPFWTGVVNSGSGFYEFVPCAFSAARDARRGSRWGVAARAFGRFISFESAGRALQWGLLLRSHCIRSAGLEQRATAVPWHSRCTPPDDHWAGWATAYHSV